MDNVTNTEHIDLFFSQIVFDKQTPLYVQLVAILENAISNGVFKTGFLPSEREMAKMLHLSRVTVSRAFDILEKKNLVYRQQGLGTKINQTIGYSLNQLIGFTERMTNRGYHVSNRWLLRQICHANTEIAKQLNLTIGSAVAYLKRVRLLNDMPVSIESTYVPIQFLPEPDKLNGSLYIYWSLRDIYPVKKQYHINAINCDNETAELLNQPKGTAILKIQEISMDQKREVLEFSETLCLGDAYQFDLEL